MEQRVIISRHLNTELTKALSECEHDRLFVLTDETTKNVCWPVMESFQVLKEAKMITIGATDQNKSLESVVHVWQELEAGGATRHSCMINLGGGMVTDLGGFAASTFKRGINFINIPTTLLAMVDAKMHFPTERMRQTVHFILENYGRPSFVCDDYDELIALMHHDKKNTGSKINFTLLSGIGKIHINQTATDEEIKEALDFLREG